MPGRGGRRLPGRHNAGRQISARGVRASAAAIRAGTPGVPGRARWARGRASGPAAVRRPRPPWHRWQVMIWVRALLPPRVIVRDQFGADQARKPPAGPGRSSAPGARCRMPAAGSGSAPRTPARRARRHDQHRQIGDRQECGSRRAVAASRRQAQPCQFAERALAGGVQPAEQGCCRRAPGDQHPCGAGRDLRAGPKMADRRAGQACQRRRDGRGGAGGTRCCLRENRLQVAPRVIVGRITPPVLRLVVPHDRRGRHPSHPSHPRDIADGHGVGAVHCEEPQRLITDDGP